MVFMCMMWLLLCSNTVKNVALDLGWPPWSRVIRQFVFVFEGRQTVCLWSKVSNAL